jgi:hypothetical protein
MANAFAVMLATLRHDPHQSVEIRYRPQSGAPLAPFRANFIEPDVDQQLQTAKVRDRKRFLSVSQSDLPDPAVGDQVEIPTGGPLYDVADFTCGDGRRLEWHITVAPA